MQREKMPRCAQVKFNATALQILNLHFQDAGLGDPKLQIEPNLSVNDKAKYREMILRVVQKF